MLKLQTGRSPDHALGSRPAEGCTSLADHALPLDGILIQNPARRPLLIALPGPDSQNVAGPVADRSAAGSAAGSEGNGRRRGRSRPRTSAAGLQSVGIALNLVLGAVTLASVLLMLREQFRPTLPFLPPEHEPASRIGYLNLGKR